MAAHSDSLPPWKLLDSGIHLQTLPRDAAPVMLLRLIERAPSRVLDVGCFCGSSGRWLKEKYPECKVYGIEPLAEAAELAAEVYDEVYSGTFTEFLTSDVPWSGELFDTVILADVLEHMFNPWKSLEDLRNLLTADALLYASIPNIRNLRVLHALAGGQWQYEGSGILDITHLRFFTKSSVVEMFQQCGYRIDRLSINPDQAVVEKFQGTDLSSIKNLQAGNLTLSNLSPTDIDELTALQFLVCAQSI